MSSQKMKDGDPRFLRVQKDPRFWEMPERDRKISIDKRFRSMFHDQRFKVKQTVDKRGRPVSHSTAEDLRRFYQLSDSDEEEEEEGRTKVREDEAEPRGRGDDDDDDEGDEDEELSAGDEAEEGKRHEARRSDEEESSSLDSEDDSDSGPDLARGKGNVETSSDEDEEDEVDAILRREEEELEHDWGELCKDAPRGEQASTRLAVCNMDWDRMKARDLLVLFGSFAPKGGAVLSVRIYPSEFGKERLKEEEARGPPELKALPEDSEEDTEEERVHREKIRDYQFKRLKYFYAVVECDSVDTAAKIYEECDGFEYESSCSVLDLRFVPEDMTFDEEPRDEATHVNPSAFTPKLFTSSAAATSKVQLTWDETDHERLTALNRKFNKDELLDMDFRAYLASSSEEEEALSGEEPDTGGEAAVSETKKRRSEEQISKYRELLKSVQDKDQKEDKDMEMEVTWVPGLKETTEKLVKEKLEGKDKLTPWEGYLQKKKEKKSGKKQGASDGELSDDQLPDDVDLSDPFFVEELGGERSDMKRKPKKKKKVEICAADNGEELEKQQAEMALLMEDDTDPKHAHFNYDRIVEQQNLSKKKRKKLLKKGAELLEDDGFQVDVQDPRFQAIFTSHLFSLDPSHPNYRKTKAMQSILAEKQRRREEQQRHLEDKLDAQEATPSHRQAAMTQEAAAERRENDSETMASKKDMDPSLSLLVKSIKSKTQQFQARKKQKTA
ncbi:ESF1 homolog isoform X1 [Oryzias latipes]|uniref:ESF1 homolog isoform X1 n=1 Tax=Oryzias latipes TaxID=8090 RepID=UPI0002A4AB06|nr:ESF1 homolog isoform X1 [Oryzias latipes]XP_020556254.1 ESF1 homolog isoform X1 [Oryzias latipes]XP_023809453.1 ESF1 homolog isoform X1 [Oryzias latipes]